MDKRKIKSTGRGFTLLELLVALAILGLSLTLVPPIMGNAIERSRLKSATRQIAAGLKYSRSKAIASQQEVVFTLDVEKKTYTVQDRNKKLALPEKTTLKLTTAKSEQISEAEGTIRFFADGSSTGGRVALNDAKLQYLVDVNWLTGKVSISP